MTAPTAPAGTFGPVTRHYDVIVAGNGPAGLALATACAERDLDVALVAPDHESPWSNTYGVWVDELEALGLTATVARRWPVTVVRTTTTVHRLARGYGLLDNARVRGVLRARFAAAGGDELGGAVAAVEDATALLDDGSAVGARVVVDATGHRPALLRWSGDPVAYQSAFGVEATCSQPPGEPDAMTLMDVRHGPLGDVREPTFLYAMDLGDDRWFVQETSLARLEPMAMHRLEARLRRRMAASGVELSDETRVERCVFPMGTPVPPPQPVFAYGAAAGMVHPATGYQVGSALAHAPEIADALAYAIGEPDARDVARQGWDTLWSVDRRRQRALHDLGLASLLRFDARQLERFFAAFFALPEGRWRSYLSDAGSVGEVRRTMLDVLGRAAGLRRTLVATAVGPKRRDTLVGCGLLPPPSRRPAGRRRRSRSDGHSAHGDGSESSIGGPSTAQ
jgi:lycopene beta-cyclase